MCHDGFITYPADLTELPMATENCLLLLRRICTGVFASLVAAGTCCAEDHAAPEGWQTSSPRKEIQPEFVYLPEGGPRGAGSFVIRADAREGLIGCWTKTFPVEGGQSYAFRAVRRCEQVTAPRRSIFPRVTWLDKEGIPAMRDAAEAVTLEPGKAPRSEPEFPLDRGVDAEGWTEVSDTYRAPSQATKAVVELWLRWPLPHGQVEWRKCLSPRYRPCRPGWHVWLPCTIFPATAGRPPETASSWFPSSRKLRANVPTSSC